MESATLSELTGDYVFDTARTRIGLVARHRMASRVRGEFDAYEGGAHLDGGDPSQSRAWLTIQAKSLRTGNEQRDVLLRGKFLRMDDHPTLSFVSDGVGRVDGSHFEVVGDLTVRGVSKPVVVNIELTRTEEDPRGGLLVHFKGGATINRNDWGVNWNAATTALVSPKVLLEFEITATRQP